jgi:hypothetical protein
VRELHADSGVSAYKHGRSREVGWGEVGWGEVGWDWD